MNLSRLYFMKTARSNHFVKLRSSIAKRAETNVKMQTLSKTSAKRNIVWITKGT